MKAVYAIQILSPCNMLKFMDLEIQMFTSLLY